MSIIKKIVFILLGVAAFLSVMLAGSAIESVEFRIGIVIAAMSAFVLCIIIARIVDKPSRLYRYFVAARVCIAAWAHINRLSKSRNACLCALLKRKYGTYPKLYKYVVNWYKLYDDSGDGVFM